jgi:hypothetical protein
MEVPERMGFVNITPDVQRAVAESGVREGLCLVNAMHITASVFINDDESGLLSDYRRWLEQLAPHDPSRYQHNRTGRTTAMPITSARSWGAKWWWPLPTANCILAPGSRFSMASLTGGAASACSSKLLESDNAGMSGFRCGHSDTGAVTKSDFVSG